MAVFGGGKRGAHIAEPRDKQKLSSVDMVHWICIHTTKWMAPFGRQTQAAGTHTNENEIGGDDLKLRE